MKYRNLWVIVILTLAMTACVGSRQNNTPAQEINSITVLPFISTNQTDAAPTPEQESGLKILTALLHDQFADRHNINFISSHEVISLVWELPGKPAVWAQKIGESRKSEAILVVRLIRFKEREGSKYSVEKPASIDFDFRLVSTKTGETLCFGRFDKTQKSLTDNMLELGKSIQRGFKWLTAEQLLREGIADSLSDCAAIAD